MVDVTAQHIIGTYGGHRHETGSSKNTTGEFKPVKGAPNLTQPNHVP